MATSVVMPALEMAQETGKLVSWKKKEGEQVKKGFESIKDFTLGGIVPPLNVTPEDHEGGGWVQIYQVKGGKFVKQTEWFRAYPEIVAAEIKKAE